MGRGEGDLKDQFRRASISIPLNIAEASGKVSPSDRGRFFAIARGSAMECAAILDCVQILFPNLQKKQTLQDRLSVELLPCSVKCLGLHW
jgi:four helix bundle protein